MQPSLANGFNAKGQELVGTIAAAAGEAPARRRAHQIVVHPLDDTAFESSRLRLGTRHTAAADGDRDMLVEKDLPILRRPWS
jgi:hypothetical protein